MEIGIAGLDQDQKDDFTPTDDLQQILQKNIPKTPVCEYKAVFILILLS